MSNENDDKTDEDPRAAGSLVPMLVVGLVLIVVGMIGALAIS
jgi:hypothetical protein